MHPKPASKVGSYMLVASGDQGSSLVCLEVEALIKDEVLGDAEMRT